MENKKLKSLSIVALIVSVLWILMMAGIIVLALFINYV